MFTKEQKKQFLFALYLTSMVLVNILGSKITYLRLFSLLEIRTSVGILFMPLLFLITDITTEVYGRKTSSQFVNLSTMMLVFMFIMTWLCIILPGHPTWPLQEAYVNIFYSSMRMTIASLISFFIAQHIDVLIFWSIKVLSKEKHLWIRNNVSTIISQFVDTTIFMFIAFYKTASAPTVSGVFTLILPYWIFKIIFALLDTPFCYLGVWWIKRSKN
ncbi:MAG: queuosine precursor transporter [Sphaerochaetaceae bacterium]|jgi:uncharacterized integral membrane protein (TIGR00697 family)